MGSLAEELMNELNCETAFTIPVFGGIPVPESCLLYTSFATKKKARVIL